MLKTTIRSLLVYGVTLLLLALVIHKVGLEELLTTLVNGNPLYVLLSLIFAQVSVIFNLFKGQMLLRAQGKDVSIAQLWRLSFVGMFFNNFLPTNVGGDIVRGYELGRLIQNSALGMASVFVERFTGFVVLTGLTAVSFVALTQYHLSDYPVLIGALLFAVVGLVAAAWLVLDRRLFGLVKRYVRWPFAAKLLGKFEKFQIALQQIASDRGVLLRAVLLSCGFYVGVFFYVYYAMMAFQGDVWFIGVALVVPITNLVAFLPLTFNGIGVTEWAYVLLFPLIGVSAPAALSAIVLIRANAVISGLIGGVLYSRMRAQSTSNAPSPVSF